MATSNPYWDERFSVEGYHFGTEPNAFVAAEAYRIAPGSRVLALADGEGRNGVFLAQQGARVTAVDASAVGIAKARALAEARDVAYETQLVDLADWQWPEAAFDAVVAIFIQFADPELRSRIFAGIARALVPGGLVLLEGYGTGQVAYRTGGPVQWPENLYTREMVLEGFRGFETLLARAHDAVIEEGRGHGGLSALVDYIGRKPAP
jgi:cyclopropane fatty-acyl-phospholipid synthase-like methyltransferase